MFFRMRYLLILITLVVLPQIVRGQCFSSAGTPVGGSENMGVLQKGTFTLTGYYRHHLSDCFYEGSRRSDVGVIRDARYNYVGSLIAYGVTDRFTTEAELGYFINKTKNYAVPAGYSLTGWGLNNALVSGKYQIYFDPVNKLEYSLALGAKLPFSLTGQRVNDVRLPYDLQPSTSTVGAVLQSYLIKQQSFTGMRYFLYNRVEVNARNREGYRYGNVFTNSFFVSRHLIRTSSWPVSGTLILQLRNEVRGRSFIHDEIEPSSGSVKFFLTPQVNLAFVEKVNLSLMVDIPVYQYYQNVQLADRVAFTVVLNKPIAPGR
ncbi:MAG: hypothetical protein R6V75_06170 [Bacteroidales bacterium]